MSKIYSGVRVASNFQHIDQFYEKGKLPLDKFDLQETYPNMMLVIKSGKHTALGVVKGDEVELVKYDQKVRNIKSRNKEQDMAIRLLQDKGIECLTLLGPAGSGKTLLALAYAMEQLEKQEISKIILCKNFTPIGREIGFLKGTFEEKVQPWLGNFWDNFEVLGVSEYEIDRINSMQYQKENPGRIELTPVTFVQGRSISNAVIIVDEAQNLTQDALKQLLTRPAENCKIILLGDPDQVFEKNGNGSGKKDKCGTIALAKVVEAGQEAEFIGHLTMIKSERSRLAEWYSKKL